MHLAWLLLTKGKDVCYCLGFRRYTHYYHHIPNRIQTICHQMNGFNLEHLAISLPTYMHLRYSYVVTLECIY